MQVFRVLSHREFEGFENFTNTPNYLTLGNVNILIPWLWELFYIIGSVGGDNIGKGCFDYLPSSNPKMGCY